VFFHNVRQIVPAVFVIRVRGGQEDSRRGIEPSFPVLIEMIPDYLEVSIHRSVGPSCGLGFPRHKHPSGRHKSRSRNRLRFALLSCNARIWCDFSVPSALDREFLPIFRPILRRVANHSCTYMQPCSRVKGSQYLIRSFVYECCVTAVQLFTGCLFTRVGFPTEGESAQAHI
jgi:hypothetical protein